MADSARVHRRRGVRHHARTRTSCSSTPSGKVVGAADGRDHGAELTQALNDLKARQGASPLTGSASSST